MMPAKPFSDADRRHRIGSRLENALEETWTTVAGRGFADVGNVPYVFGYFGLPRALHVSYRYRF